MIGDRSRPLLEVIRGVSAAGDVAEQIRATVNNPDYVRAAESVVLSVEPGDLIAVGDATTGQLSLAAPIAYDVYYLWGFDRNILPSDKAESEAVVEPGGELYRYLEKLGGIKPLRTLRGPTDLNIFEKPVRFNRLKRVWETKEFWKNTAPYCVKRMRFEIISPGGTIQYPTPAQENDHYVYCAFPICQLGVMEILSIYRQTEDLDDPYYEASGFQQNMMPPVTRQLGRCGGEQLVKLAYALQGDADHVVEYPAGNFPDENEDPHFWIRRWYRGDEQRPTPGEFVGMLARPMPFHVWWFQETSPLLYAGNWFETRFYTSGIVTAIETDSENRRWYTVEVRGKPVTLGASDYYEYQVDERVAVLKRFYDGHPGAAAFDFTWEELGDAPETFIILPLSFYEYNMGV